MEAGLKSIVADFRLDTTFKTFNMQSILDFQPYADWFLKNSEQFQAKGQIYGMNDEYNRDVCSILLEDMMLNITDTSKLYDLTNTCFYLYLMACCLLNLQKNQKYMYLYHNLFSLGGFEQQSLSGNFLLPNTPEYKPLLDILNIKKIPRDSKDILNNSNIQICNLHYNPVLKAIIEESEKKDMIDNEAIIQQMRANEPKSNCPLNINGDCYIKTNPGRADHATHMVKFIHIPPCQYGSKCFRTTNQEHNKDFFHPPVPAASAIHTVKKIGVPGSIFKGSRVQRGAPSGSSQRGGKKKNGTKKNRPKKTHKKRQNKHKKRHNKSKKLI